MSSDEGSYEELAPLGAQRDIGAQRGGGAQRDAASDVDRGPRSERAPRGKRGESRVEDAPPPLVARSAGELLDLGLEILRDRFLSIVGVCVVVWIPARALEPLIGSSTFFENPNAMTETPAALLGLGGIAFSGFLQVLVQALASALVARLVYASVHGERVELRAAIGEASRRVVGLIGIALITAVVTTMGCCFLFVPFVYLHWKLSLAPSVYVLEGGGVGQSLTRSFALTPGSFARWLAIVVVVFCLTVPFSGLVAFQPQGRAYVIDALGMPGVVFDVVMILLSSVFMGLATAIASVTLTLYYIDCRVRREGYDARRTLAEMQASLDATRGSSGGPPGKVAGNSGENWSENASGSSGGFSP